MLAGMLISLSAFVVSVVTAKHLLGLTMESRWVLPATVVFLLQERLLAHATQAWAEGAYVASTLLALLVFGVMSRNNYRLPARRYAVVMVAVVSCVVAAPFWLRHIGFLIPLSVCTALLVGASRTGDRLARRDCILVAAGTGCLALALLVHTYSVTGTLTGQPAGLAPGYTFTEALRAMVRQTGLDSLGIPFRISEKLEAAAPSLFLAATVMVLSWLVVTLDRAPLPRLIAFNVFGYLFLLVLAVINKTRRGVDAVHLPDHPAGHTAVAHEGVIHDAERNKADDLHAGVAAVVDLDNGKRLQARTRRWRHSSAKNPGMHRERREQS